MAKLSLATIAVLLVFPLKATAESPIASPKSAALPKAVVAFVAFCVFLGGLAVAIGLFNKLRKISRARRFERSVADLGLRVHERYADTLVARGDRGKLVIEVTLGPPFDGPFDPAQDPARLTVSVTGPDSLFSRIGVPWTDLGPEPARNSAVVAALVKGLVGHTRGTDKVAIEGGSLRLRADLTAGRDMHALLDAIITEADNHDLDSNRLGDQLLELAKAEGKIELRVDALRTIARVWPGRIPAADLDAFANLPEQTLRAAALTIDSEPRADRARRLAALVDPSPAVVLEAGLHLGERGHDSLCRLAQGDDVAPEVRRRAFEAIEARLSEKQRLSILSKLAQDASETSVWALELLAVDESPDAKASMDALQPTNLEAARAIIRVLRRRKTSCALVRLLDYPNLDIVEGAIDALGEVGGRSMVPALSRFLERSYPLPVQQAADFAILRIQADSSGEAGGLGLVADDNRGTLSEPTDLGALSIPKVS